MSAQDPLEFRSLAGLDRELSCPACGGSLCLERLTARCAEAASRVTSTVVLGFGELDGEMRRVWLTVPERRDGVTLRFACTACLEVMELLFATKAGSTAVCWHDLARQTALPCPC